MYCTNCFSQNFLQSGACAEIFAFRNLRKTWRAWKHLAKKDALVGWPPCAQRDPQLLEVIAMIDETSDTKGDDAAEARYLQTKGVAVYVAND